MSLHTQCQGPRTGPLQRNSNIYPLQRFILPAALYFSADLSRFFGLDLCGICYEMINIITIKQVVIEDMRECK